MPSELQAELNRRKLNRSLDFTKSTTASWDYSTGDWNTYKGPMTAWIRACSNGLGRPDPSSLNKPLSQQEFKKPGFVLYGGKDFYKTYGFFPSNQSNHGGESVIGYTPTGDPHSLIYDYTSSPFPIHTPTPEIVKITMTVQKELFRRAKIDWICFSFAQLEYMTPYWLVPGISVILEFGWNHFNPQSLLDLTDIGSLMKIWDNPYPLYSDNILRSNGNYDAIWGIITNFDFSMDNNIIRCSTEITSKDRIYAGISTDSVVIDNQSKKNQSVGRERTQIEIESVPKMFTNLKNVCGENFIQTMRSISENGLDDRLQSSGGSTDLIQLCKKLSSEGRESYWRGVFFGRPENSPLSKRKRESDFDYTLNKNEQTWINLGFITELMNFCLPVPSITDDGKSFFDVDVDDCIISGHVNLISCDSRVLIPNALAPKYNWSAIPPDESDPNYRYWQDIDQYVKENKSRITIPTNEPSGNDSVKSKWFADVQLSKVFLHGTTPLRDNLDEIINFTRYRIFQKNSFCFPFINSTIEVYGDDSITYPSHRYGRYKDLYINAKTFVDIVNSVSKNEHPTYVAVYEEIFDILKQCSAGFWDLSLVDAVGTKRSGRASMKITDNRMVPVKNDKNQVYYFNYGEADSIIKSLSFKPALTNSQATRVIFSDSNNKDSNVVLKSEGDLLNYQFKDRILIRKDQKPSSESTPNDTTDERSMVGETRNRLQELSNPPVDRLPVTIDESIIVKKQSSQSELNAITSAARASGGNVGPISVQQDQFQVISSKRKYVSLVLPNSSFLSLLLSDGDTNYNSRYYGIQPNITLEMTVQGIGGIRTFQMFLIRNLPDPYSDKNVVFRIIDVESSLENGNWETTIKAGLLPLRDAIKKQLGIV